MPDVCVTQSNTIEKRHFVAYYYLWMTALEWNYPKRFVIRSGLQVGVQLAYQPSSGLVLFEDITILRMTHLDLCLFSNGFCKH